MKNGIVHIKTDNTPLFDYTLEVLGSEFQVTNLVYTYDLYQADMLSDHFSIQTRFEKMYLGRGEKIKYLKFQFPG